MSDERVSEEEITDTCPTCGSIDTTLDVQEYDDGPGERPKQVEVLICFNCDHEWELEA